MIQMMELQQLLLLSSHPQLLFEPKPPLLPHPPQKNKRIIIHHMLFPLLPHPLLHPHPLLDLALQSLHPQFDKSPIKASMILNI